MKKISSIICLAIFCLTLGGCAHSISITPDLAKIELTSNSVARVNVKVGYYIPPELSAIEITTAGGGGDNVRYYPYREIENGFQKILSNNFVSVVKLTSAIELAQISQEGKEGIKYSFFPELITNSGGSGLFTWPPTNFTVDLTVKVRDANGTVIGSPRVIGVGSADTSERLSKYGIAGERAMEDALLKMQAALREMKFNDMALKVSAQQQSLPDAGNSVELRLIHIKDLKLKGLISDDEYEFKRKEIIDGL